MSRLRKLLIYGGGKLIVFAESLPPKIIYWEQWTCNVLDNSWVYSVFKFSGEGWAVLIHIVKIFWYPISSNRLRYLVKWMATKLLLIILYFCSHLVWHKVNLVLNQKQLKIFYSVNQHGSALVRMKISGFIRFLETLNHRWSWCYPIHYCFLPNHISQKTATSWQHWTYIIFNAFAVHKEASATIITSS